MVRPDQVSLGVLVNAVPRDLVDEAVAVCGVREKRSDGKLPAHVIRYLTLALCLFANDDYREVATKVTGSLDRWGCWNAAWTVPTTSAITQARKRLGRRVFAELFERCCGPVAGTPGPTAEVTALGTARGAFLRRWRLLAIALLGRAQPWHVFRNHDSFFVAAGQYFEPVAQYYVALYPAPNQ